MLNHVSLFSGYGGLDLGLKMAIPDLRTVLYCEYDRYAQGVLISRMRDGGLDPAPIWTDVRTLDGRCWRGCVDIISGGFPCQDVSVAGKRAGVKEGNRSGLWFEYARLIDEIRPSFAFIENVAGLVSNGFDRVLCDLAAMGYDAEWGVVSAAEAGANHRRERLWILAYTKSADTRQLVSAICEWSQGFTGGGATFGDNLLDAVMRKMLPTPTGNMISGGGNHNSPTVKSGNHGLNLKGFVQMYPTPTSNTAKNTGDGINFQKRADKFHLDGVVALQDGTGKLNPQWVAWLMGLNTEWINLDSSVMEWFRSKPRSRSKSSAKG